MWLQAFSSVPLQFSCVVTIFEVGNVALSYKLASHCTLTTEKGIFTNCYIQITLLYWRLGRFHISIKVYLVACTTDCLAVSYKINVKKTEFIYKCYRLTHRKQQKIRTVNLVVEHIVTTPTRSATKFTVLIFAVFDV